MSFVKIDLNASDKKKDEPIQWAHIEEKPANRLEELVDLIDKKEESFEPTFGCFSGFRTDQKYARIIWASANLSKCAGVISQEAITCMDSDYPDRSEIIHAMSHMLIYMQILADSIDENLITISEDAKGILENGRVR